LGATVIVGGFFGDEGKGGRAASAPQREDSRLHGL